MSIPQIEYTATIPPKGGTADDAGAKSHVFLACNDELAREICAAMDWRYDGRALGPVGIDDEQTGESWKKKTAKPKSKRKTKAAPQYRRRESGAAMRGNPPLSINQIKALAIEARIAFDHLETYDLIEEEGKTKTARFDAWRANICKDITGKKSFREICNDDFRPLKAEFLKLAGRKWEDPKVHLTGKQSAEKLDTMERREMFVEKIAGDLIAHVNWARRNGEDVTVGDAYVLSIARRKNPKSTIADYSALVTLPADRIKDLFYTVRNRIAAKEGRGKSSNRNKKQRGEE